MRRNGITPSANIAAHGVTSLLPTVITAPFDALRGAADRVDAAMRNHPGIIGLHLEGPFQAAAKAGAHRVDWLQDFDEDSAAALLALPALRLVTLHLSCPAPWG